MKPEKQTLGIDLGTIDKIRGAKSHKERVYRAAMMYVGAGIPVIPLRPNTKILYPRTNYKMATTDPRKVDEWFDPKIGKFAGGNIGIACGMLGGVFAIDVDPKNGGDETLKVLESQFGPMPPCPTQKTPSGGWHFLFEWERGAVSRTNALGEGIDTRGGTIESCKSHIVAWPSVVDGNEYEWVSGGIPARIPEWVRAEMGMESDWHDRPEFVGDGRGLEQATDDDPKVTLRQLKEMLEYVDPDNLTYDEWVRVGMAIKTQYPGEDGLKVWDEWSQQGKRYRKNECYTRWRGLSEFGRVRIGTIIWMAKQEGWKPGKGDANLDPLAAVVEEMNKHNAVVVVGGKMRILSEKPHTVHKYDKPYNLLSPTDFKIYTAPMKVQVDPEKKPVLAADLWLASSFRREYPHGIKLMPPGVHVDPLAYNLWKGYAYDPAPGDCSLFKQHIKEKVCGGDEDLYEWTLDWCAQLIQKPGVKAYTALVMYGPEGCGKGTFAQVLMDYFRPHATHITNPEHLVGKFNSHIAESIVVYADEVTWGGYLKTQGTLKAMVTEDVISIERKGMDKEDVRNMAHLIIATNEEWSIPAGTSSRRWAVFKMPDIPVKGRKKYFDALYDELNNGGREAFLYEMLERRVTRDMTSAPVTEGLKEQRRITLVRTDNIEAWLHHIKETGSPLTRPIKEEELGSTYKTTALYDEYVEWCNKRRWAPQHINQFSPKLGNTPGMERVRVRVDGEKTRCIVIKEEFYDEED